MMLKSTHTPSAAAAAPLPPGWTEHKAPTGHSYYYHAESKQSSYTRPGLPPAPTESPSHAHNGYGVGVPSLADPRAANAYLAQFRPEQSPRGGRGGFRGGRGGAQDGRARPQPVDKPRRKEAIPGCEPWILVYTKYSRRFVYNPVKNASWWRIPEKLMPGILELDKKRIREKAGIEEKKDEAEKGGEGKQEEEVHDQAEDQAEGGYGDSSDEYEEVEVTDDEGQDRDRDQDQDGGHPLKRQRTEEPPDEGPVEFTEADILQQLQAMGEDYGLEPGDYDDGNEQDWPEGAGGVEFSDEDAKMLFKDLLSDFGVNPYSPWEKLIEEGKVMEDARYTALSTTKARRECWDEWSRERIKEIREERAKQEKKDPRIGYLAFLQEKATPKLYWPEFKRKYKKEAAMKDMGLADRDKEKLYREHIGRLKMSQGTLKADLTALLKAQPVHLLHNRSLAGNAGLPTPVLTDLRYISLAPSSRDPLISAYVSTLPPPPENIEDAAADDEEGRKTREARERRERALRERDRAVDEQRRRRERDVAVGRARLREEERELEMAMRVGKRGLQSQLEANSG